MTPTSSITEKGLAAPADWKPGDKVDIPAPLAAEAVEKCLKEPRAEVKDGSLAFENQT